MLALLLAVSIGPAQGAAGGGSVPAPQEVIAEVRVHGNAAIPEEDVLGLAGVRAGAPFTADTPAAVAARLRESGRFRRVEVLKRFASIADPTQIIVVIVVDEGPVKIEWDRDAGVSRTVRQRGPGMMFLPVLDAEDGYGLTYGARFALPGVAGSQSRLAFLLTWGGDKRAGAQLEKDFSRGPFDRVIAGASASRRRHPFYDQNEDRFRIWTRAERQLASDLRVGGAIASERNHFLGRETRFVQLGADILFDTRVDPFLARNAGYARLAWDRFAFSGSDAVRRRSIDARGYLGLAGQSVLVGRVLRSDASGALPPFLAPMLGGMDNLRGLKAGSDAGDHLVAASVEWRVPLTSPLNVGRLGVSAFGDTATVYDHRERLRDQRFVEGFGGGVWLTAAFLRLNLAVAHAVGGDTRVHFGSTLTF